MTKESKVRDVLTDIRLTALNVEDIEAKNKLIKIAQSLDDFVGSSEDYSQIGGSPAAPMQGFPSVGDSVTETPQKPSKFGIDQEQKRYYKVTVDFLYIPASDNLEAREKITEALGTIPEFAGKYNVGEAQGMSVKEPS